MEAKFPILELRQTNVQLAEFRASVVLNYSCCGVRIELAYEVGMFVLPRHMQILSVRPGGGVLPAPTLGREI